MCTVEMVRGTADFTDTIYYYSKIKREIQGIYTYIYGCRCNDLKEIELDPGTVTMITISTVDHFLVSRTDEPHLVDDLCHQVHEDPDLQTLKVGVC